MNNEDWPGEDEYLLFIIFVVEGHVLRRVMMIVRSLPTIEISCVR